MQIIKKGTMPDGTKIQIEDWSENYSCYSKCGTVAAYPIAKASIKRAERGGIYAGAWYYPTVGEEFRVCLNFDCADTAALVFDKLILGESQLKDYTGYMHNPEHSRCL